MILSCNSCGKKFVVPDNAITQAGRLVQCSACGNKWKQFPIKTSKKKEPVLKPDVKPIITKPKTAKKHIGQKKPLNPKRKIPKKKREINLYSPEYLAKKHGIKIVASTTSNKKTSNSKEKLNFGFYNFLLVLTIFIIALLRSLYFLEDFIVENVPITEMYIDYLFESIRNIRDIIQNFFSNY